MRIKFVKPFSGRRLRARRICEHSFAREVAARAVAGGCWVYDVTTGGSVCNSYGYAASTEVSLAVADVSGHTAVWCSRAHANKVTLRGAAEECLPGAGDLFDLRITSADRLTDAREMLQRAQQAAWSPLERLAMESE